LNDKSESSRDLDLLKPLLPRTLLDWLRVFGPGAIVASLTIGTGELIFSARGGAIFGYDILFLFAVVALLKWALVVAASRQMLLTGVHPYERMLELPGPRGWLPISLLLLCAACMPIWISFHSGVTGNLMSWVTGTKGALNGAVDYAWGAAILAGVLVLTYLGGYSVLEKVQLAVVGALVFCAGLTLVLYNPNWLEILRGLIPEKPVYPEWFKEKYPDQASHSVWVETTRYVGVIGGAGFDYLAYTSWLREKRWGILPQRASRDDLEQIAADPNHEVRKWLRAPIIDCTISFLLVVAFSAVFVASGVLILRPNEVIPDEDNFLNLQAKFVTNIHEWLLPVYLGGAFFTMIGTLYGTVEIACAIGDEIVRTLYSHATANGSREWTKEKSARLKKWIVAWSGGIAMIVLGSLFVRQLSPDEGAAAVNNVKRNSFRSSSAADPSPEASADATPIKQKPRLLLSLLTPVNLITGVLSCSVVAFLTIWIDRKHLPRALRQPWWLLAINVCGGVIFVVLWVAGVIDNKDRTLALAGMFGLIAAGFLIALGWQIRNVKSRP
jgi:hypothetical protein